MNWVRAVKQEVKENIGNMSYEQIEEMCEQLEILLKQHMKKETLTVEQERFYGEDELRYSLYMQELGNTYYAISKRTEELHNEVVSGSE